MYISFTTAPSSQMPFPTPTYPTGIAVMSARVCVCTLSGNLNNGRMSAWRAESVFYIRMAQLEIFRRKEGVTGSETYYNTRILYCSRGYMYTVCVC